MLGRYSFAFAAAIALFASPRPLLWHDPGNVESLNFHWGPGGHSREPAPPFRFVRENLAGSSPKVQVTDAHGRLWSVKWGPEVQADSFASRIAWACGYFVEPEFYVTRGHIHELGRLARAKNSVTPDGRFVNARFQLWDKRYKFLEQPTWSWVNNPFLGTRELDGLKVILMLVSDWDNKDSRDIARDSNTGILQPTFGPPRWLYFIADWGASMGKWGRIYARDKWDCTGFTGQTPNFVKGVHNGMLVWGYHGQHTGDALNGIPVEHVRWLLRYLGRITDHQLMQGLKASGAAHLEAECFTHALRDRIEQLRYIARTWRPNTEITRR